MINTKTDKNGTLEKNIYIMESEIHGEGIFTSIDIPAGEKIMVISGEVISAEECVRRENEEDNVYIFDRDSKSLYLVAFRDIKKGEELTIDYGYDEIYEYCNCSKCLYRKAI